MYETLYNFILTTFIISTLVTAVLLFLTIRARIRRSRNPNKPSRFRALAITTATVAIIATATFFIPRIILNQVIEPVGGMSFDRGQSDYPETSTTKQEGQLSRTPATPTPQRRKAPAPQASADTQTDTGAPLYEQPSNTWVRRGMLASTLRDQRVIVHSADTALVVTDIPATIRHISDMAYRHGGWLINSHQESSHTGSARFRVPAGSLDAALRELLSLADKVEHIDLSSEDVTDEFVDLSSSLPALQASEKSYLAMLSASDQITETLAIRKRLDQVRTEIAEIKGRLNYLSQVAAFSLVSVSLSLSPQTITVQAGPDRNVQAGQPVLFDTRIVPLDQIENFQYNWDFGDGSDPATGSNTALVVTDGSTKQRITNPISHIYHQEGRHIVQVDVYGSGEAITAKGTDSIIITVKAVPSISTSVLPPSPIVTYRDDLKLTAVFTRHPDLSDYESHWDFGDGTPTLSSPIPHGISRSEVTHAYNSGGYASFMGTLTITATSAAGPVASTTTFNVTVKEPKDFIGGNWDPGNWFKTAARAFTATLSAFVLILVWTLVFSPILALLGGGIYLAHRKGWIGDHQD